MTTSQVSPAVFVHAYPLRVAARRLAFLTLAILSGCGGGESATYVTNARSIPTPLGYAAYVCSQMVDEAGQPVGPPNCPTILPTPPRQAVEWELQNLPGRPHAIQGSGCRLLRGGESMDDAIKNWMEGWSAKVVLRMKDEDARRLILASNGDWISATESAFLALAPCDQLPDGPPPRD